ncbi:MAG: hypothetical protein COA78_06810 [Blastopirellula sp.]|nr:MAG: hypothetical protein COA78_06810 [Blastopirellula sp.]
MIAAFAIWLVLFSGFVLCAVYEISQATKFKPLSRISIPAVPLYDDLHDNPKKFETEAAEFLGFLYTISGELTSEARRINKGIDYEV